MSQTRTALPGATALFVTPRIKRLSPGALVDIELAKGTRCSMEYRDGMVDALTFRMHGIFIQPPYRVGSAALDAYNYGQSKGFALWRTLKAEAKNATTADQEASHV